MSWRRSAWRIAVPAGFGLLLVAAVCSDMLLADIARDHFRAESDIRLDPGGLKVYANARVPPLDDGPSIVFFGDSRALMWPPPPVPGYKIVNRGIGKQTTAQMLLRFDADVAQLHPAVVVLEGGVNDLKAIAEMPSRRSEIIADCEANLARIVDECRKTGATVVLVTIFPIGDLALWRRPFWSGDVAGAVRDVNAFLSTLAGAKVILVEADAALVDSHGAFDDAYQLDYLHLSPRGYTALNRQLLPVLSALPK